MEILAATPSAAFAAKHARIVREKAVLRALVRVGQSILREAAEGPGDTDDLIGRIEHMLFEVAQHGQQRRARPVHEFLEETYRYIYEYQNRRLLGLSTGIYELNEVLNGLQPGYFYVVAGRPSMGKTSLALRLLEEVTMGPDPVPALFVSLEMPGEVIARILLCSRCHVSVHKLHQGMISKEEQKRLLEHSHLLDRAPLLLDDSPDLTIHELRARARRLRSDPKHPIRLVVVDYLQLLRAPEAESRQLEISEISRGLKAMAKDMNIPVVALAQLNRQPEGREGHKPRLADLRESGSIEQDADVVMLLYREEYYNPDTERKNIADIIIAKNRTGPTGEVQAVFHAPLMRFEPLARVAQEAVATAAVPPRGGSVPDEESAF
jgi:replicative DNA helicase